MGGLCIWEPCSVNSRFRPYRSADRPLAEGHFSGCFGSASGAGAGTAPEAGGPALSTRFCTDKFNGKYPHVGLYDCRERKVWVAKPLAGQAIRTSHARLITGADNATRTVWKDRFLCFWFYTPRTGEGTSTATRSTGRKAHLLVRIDPNWDYDRQRLMPPELEDQVNAEPRAAVQARRADLRVFPRGQAEVPDQPALHRPARDRVAVLREADRGESIADIAARGVTVCKRGKPGRLERRLPSGINSRRYE